MLKFDFFHNETSFWIKIKTIFLISQVLSFRLKKQTSKNVADTTFNILEKLVDILHFIIIWVIFQQFSCRDLKAVAFLIFFKKIKDYWRLMKCPSERINKL